MRYNLIENLVISEILRNFVVNKNNKTKEFRYDYRGQNY